uniref:Uncharacterized protein n=1 Tax=viral metagenome TaxID=1070528 RepID=A0A6M3J6A5_9ZZZZ
MARYCKKGVARDGNGKIISSATVSFYLAGTTTVASVYAASAGGVAVNSVASGTDGVFTAFFDDTDYYQSQLFKLVMSKSGYTSVTYDNVIVFPLGSLTIIAAVPSNSVGSNGDFLILEATGLHHLAWKAGDIWYTTVGGTTEGSAGAYTWESSI